MKRMVVGLLCALIAALSLSISSYALEQAITFDETVVAPAGAKGYNAEPPTGKYLTNEYAGAPYNVRFTQVLPLLKLQDGTVYQGGTWGITGAAGPQFMGCDGYINPLSAQKYAGMVVEFNSSVVAFSIDFTVGEGTGLPPNGAKLDYIAYAHNDDGFLYNLTGSITFPGVNTWKPITIGTPDAANLIYIDRVKFTVYLGEVAPDDGELIAAAGQAPASIGGGELYVDAYLGFDNLRIITPPIADFSADPLDGCADLEVCFTDLSIGAETWFWDFGDGTTSEETDPCHTYTDPGVYTVSLTVSNGAAQDSVTKTDYITVVGCEQDLRAAFRGTPTNGCAPLDVCFTDLSETAVSWQWSFGDGATSTQQNPCHRYNAPGSYTVSLTISNGQSFATEKKAAYVQVQACAPPIADFFAIPTSGLKPLAVQFYNQSIGGITYSWDFGDGATSTEKNPSHVYPNVGVYTVFLTATNPFGSDTRTRISYIIVYDQCAPPVADFSVSYPSPLIAQFTDLSTNAQSWTWDFGDGSTSTDQNPLHVYAEEGTYDVSLTVYNQCGADTKTMQTNIAPVFSNLLYFPYVVSGDGWETEIGIVNTSDGTPLGGRLEGFTDMGDEVLESVPVVLQSHERKLLTVGSAFANTPEKIRYAILVAPTVDVEGYARIYKDGQYRSSIPAVRKVSQGDLIISHVASNPGTGWETKIILLNTDPSEQNVVIDLDDEIDVSRKAEVSLPANGQFETTIGGFFGGFKQPTIMSGVVKNGAGVIGVVIYERGKEMDAVLLTEKTDQALYFPHLVCRPWWATGVVMYNPSDDPFDMTIIPYDAAGNEMTPTSITLGSREKYVGTWCVMGLPADAQWCRIEADSNYLTGIEAFFRLDRGQMVAYQGSIMTPKNKGVFPILDDEEDGWTGIVLVNTENEPATVVLTAYDDAGATVAEAVLYMDGHAKVAQLIGNLFGDAIGSATYISYRSDREMVGLQGIMSPDFTMLDGLPSL